MAGLEEQAQWENDVYQIETTDPVVGGPPDLAQAQGITNVPHLHLANRTAWLKAQVDALNTLLAGGVDQYVSDDELATAIAGFVTQAAIDAAVNNLVDGAPAALNTLKELADELGDNDDAIAVLTAQIAGKLNTSAYTAADILAKLKTVDGNGSGLDADLLDGLSSSTFARSTRTISAGTGLTGGGSLASNRTISASIPTQAEAEAGTIHSKLMTPLRTKQAITKAINVLVDGAPAALNTLKELADELAGNDNAIAALTTQIGTKLNASNYTAADILVKLKTVDGAGSGLDADRLDGVSSGSFVRLDINNSLIGLLDLRRNADQVLRLGYNVGQERSTYMSFYRGEAKRAGYIQARADRMRIKNDAGAQIDLFGSKDVRVNDLPVMLAVPKYTSSELTFGAYVSINHGLGRVPAQYQVVVRCKVANNGYAVGDEIQITGMGDGDGTRGYVSWANGTYIRFRNQSSALQNTSGNYIVGSSAQWKYVVYAW